MNIEFDFSELDKFAKSLANTYRFDAYMKKIARNIAKVLHQQLLSLTPVDTGNLRRHWQAGDNLSFTVTRVGDQYEVVLINTASKKSAKYPDGFMYGLAVEDGHKTPSGDGWVVGRFFVKNSIEATLPNVEQIVMQQLQLWWKGV